jgi:hypothetical protein
MPWDALNSETTEETSTTRNGPSGSLADSNSAPQPEDDSDETIWTRSADAAWQPSSFSTSRKKASDGKSSPRMGQ